MCGILAVLTSEAKLDPQRLQGALGMLRHRGPDGSGLWVDAASGIALGHTRLAIVDPLAGQQPLSNQDGTIHAVVNGEFYGDAALRRKLESRGHRFRTRCDSELLLHLYEEHGLDALEQLRGEFAFVLWDVRRRRLFAARDRFGIKPLVWAQGRRGLLLASEAKALFALGHEARWDATSFMHAAAHQYLPPDRSLFSGVEQLPPGSALLAEQGSVRQFSYWELDFPQATEVEAQDERESIQGLRSALEESVRLRLRADVPVACTLSGGVDSAAVAALANRASDRELPCFGVSFEHAPYDEAGLAREIARQLGSRFETVSVGQEDLLEVLPDAVWHAEGLAINGQLSAKFLLSKAIAKAGYKVVLTGEGADEALYGYAHLAQDALISLPSGEAAALRRRIDAARSTQGGVMLPGAEAPAPALSAVLSSVQSGLGHVPTFLKAKAAIGLNLQALLDEDWRAVLARSDPFESLLKGFDVAGQLAGRRPVEQAAHLWTRLALAGYILRTLGDGTEMAHSVEGRPPFLDHELFARCRDLPLGLKFRNGVEKYALRAALRPLLSESVLQRRKHPFLAPPVTRYSSSRIRERISDTLESRSFAAVPFFSRSRVRALRRRLDTADSAAQTAAEPALMMALCSAALQERFSLGDPP